MLKEHSFSEEALENEAVAQIKRLLAPLPFSVEKTQTELPAGNGIDFVVKVKGKDRAWLLVCEVKRDGQPRHIRYAALQAREYASRIGKNSQAYPVVIAPYISPASAGICKEMDVGYADLAGNCHLTFDTVYIDRQVPANPFRVRREQRSLFAPKSARMLRALLTDPSRAWKVEELAQRCHVSLGQVSNVRRMLLDREWASGKRGELRIARPHAVLDEWQSAYSPPRISRSRYYTLLHGQQLEREITEALETAKLADALTGDAKGLILSSFSAARWIAPFARVSGEYFYADAACEAHLKKRLQLEPAPRGENIVVDRPKDDGVFLESLEPKPGLSCTGLIQTYLDLYVSGERGQEAAEHLRQTKIDPLWQGLK